MLRYRGKKNVIDKVKEFDAFPKVPEKYVDSTPVGGTFSVITFFIILWLIYSEVAYYLDSNLVFKFSPDTEMDEKLRINIDITVAMPCSNIGADILDSTSQSVFGFGELTEEDTWFELTQEQQDAFGAVKYLNSYLREEYHSIWQLLWKKGHGSVRAIVPARKTKPNRRPDACRLHGILTLNKVAGNFHVTAGKSLHLPRGHIHLNMLFDDTPQNFSHRIHRLSFGSPANGIIYPLEGDEKITTDENMLYQYFIEVVPTDVDTAFESIKTYQYSVKELERPISHLTGSHGVPGIFFKYDMAALKIYVYQERENFLQFMLRLFSIIGGIYIIVGCFNALVLKVQNIFIKKAAPSVLNHTQMFEKRPVQLNPLLIQTDLNVPLGIVKQ
ncbi:LOW QUALITY PROTEIN: endoplasmic reticulum-Golgi intermediate compartment protein 2-like [Leguminivora glycinivorella]|uniref:LOW QUALITY PROTEIN: endoplasmic reticulum-Golgi intermediate compartment protein 2-like n=1 Tax=Leguminivora glycinivorella TaxID=1035111 RepID=UPI00200FA6F2|nr:LOW QUALITY PROTEIN: endoplasmic reticulum-Golgi intermediate compartment protein 2-like [Leguminivora glycinivorella]